MDLPGDPPPTHELAPVTLETPHGTLTALWRPGQGTPVVVVHGVMADAFAWKHVVVAVAPERPALVLNRRGRAPSAPIPDAYGVGLEVADLLGWLATLEGPVDLVGHSYGGLVAVEAVRLGAAVRSLVLYEPVASPFGADVVPLVEAAVGAGDLDAAVEIIDVDLSGYSREHVEELRAGAAWDRLRRLSEPAAPELAAIGRHELATPRGWEVPTTLVAGELSRHRPPYGPGVELFRETLGLDDVVVLAGHDHIAHVTGPLELAAVIEAGLSA